MQQTTLLIDTVKRVLKARGMTYGELAKKIGLSEASVKRLFSEQTLTLRKLEQICQALDLDFFELAKLGRGVHDVADHLSLLQEQALADEPKLLAVFYLLYNDWQLADMIAHYEITEVECVRRMAALHRLGLIELLPANKVKLRIARGLRLRQDGPIRQRYGQAAMEDFLQVKFEEHEGHFRFEFRELSVASVELLKRRIDRLAAEFLELAELDSTLPSTRRRSIGFAMGIRPWQISFVTGLKPR